MVTTEEAAMDLIPPEQRESPDSYRHAANANREGNTPVVPEKPSEDGYNWRKYGQKNVKGNKLVRSYYKCSYHNCLVKKQVERAHDGRITDTSYFGKHDHPKPQTGLAVAVPSVLSVKVQTVDNRSPIIAEELKETNVLAIVPTSIGSIHDAASPSSATKDCVNNDDNLGSKRRKKGVEDAMSIDDKPTSESRRVVETVSAVDIVNDGYRWRKYGQKLVKDNPNARSYYKCSTPGCPAKKRVERASHDPKVVITTYESHHDHDVPPVRTLLPLSHSPAASTASERNGVNNKPEEASRAQSSAAICKQKKGNTIDHPTEKDDPGEVNQAQSSAAICKQEKGNTINHPAEKNDRAEINQAQSSASICKQEKGNTIDYPTEKGDPGEANQTQRSVAICKEEGNTTDHPAKKYDPAAVNQAQSTGAICQQEQGNTINHRAEKDDTAEVNRAQRSATICKQEQGDMIDHPAEKDDPTEVNLVRSSATICKREQGDTTDQPVKEDNPNEVNQVQSGAAICKQEHGVTTDHPAGKDEPPVNLTRGCDNPP